MPGDVAGLARCARPAPAVYARSFESAYDSYFDYVWRVVRRLGIPEASAEDAAHDVFLVVHRQLRGFEGRSTLKTWIYGIAIRVARDYRRRDRRKGGLEALPDDLSIDRTPEDESADHEAVRLLDRVLCELSEDKREAYVLSEIEGMSIPEILTDFPELTEEDIRACLAFAADRERRLAVIGG